MTTVTFVLAVRAAAALSLFAWLVHLERTNRPQIVVVMMLALLVLDGALYTTAGEIPRGFFHPEFGGRPFRLPDVFVPLALAAVMVSGTRRRRLGPQSFWWAAFFVWLGTAAILGIRDGNSSTLVAFEAKAIIYLGAMALAARVPFRAYVEGRHFRMLLYGSAALAVILSILAPSGVRFGIALPGLPVPKFGGLGSDGASIFAALGVIALALAVCRKGRRVSLVLTAIALLFPIVVVGQRAALLGGAASLFLLAVLAPFGWRRVRIAVQPTFAVAAAVLVVFLVPAAVVASLGPDAPIPAAKTPGHFVASSVRAAFTAQGKRSSAEARLDQWRKSVVVVRERPVLGWGLGEQYVYWDPGLYQFVQSDLSHDVPLDLLRRTGLIGLALFLAALAASMVQGVRVWRYESDPAAAALALGCVAVIGGLVAKGLVESILEKYRLALLLGLTIGILHSALRSQAAQLRERDVPVQ